MRKLALSSCVAAAVFGLSTPREAEACGGTFCDGGPNAQPVDQTGENILFVMGDAFVEAHIQIQYDPDSEAMQFAWVVPLLAVPEFSVGSQPLFDAILGATVPAYGFTTTFDDSCFGGTDSNGSFTSGGSDGGGSGTGAGDSTGGGGPEVVLNEIVGAFEVVVLQGGTAAEVMTWLGMNGYQQDPAAEPILEEYLAEGYVFAAFKLTNDAEVAEIHPVTLRFDNNEACVPLRLTRIAAQEDMDVRTFFLADDRVVPQNYKHVLVNPLKLDWTTQASNYKEVITLAVDADQANGHAFVTEYAGPTSIVPTFSLWSPSWNATAFETIDPTMVVDELASQGLMECGGFGGTTGGGDVCAYNHPLLRGLLQKYLPVPDGLDEIDFYGCLVCYMDQIDQMAWDAAAFAADMQSRIIDPGAHALTLLETWPTLSRMYTTISPAEMTADPFFYENPDLQEVDLTNQVATRTVYCNQYEEVWTLPDGREVYVPGGAWPAFDDEMPWEEDVEEVPSMGAPIGLVDNSELIDQKLFEHNCQYNWPSSESCGNPPGGTSGGVNGTATSGSDTDGGTSGSAGQDSDGKSGGCGCSTAPSGGTLGLLALVVFGPRRRRRMITRRWVRG